MAEMLSKDFDHQLVEYMMTAMFSQHIKEIIGDQPLTPEVTSRWLSSLGQSSSKWKLDGLDGLVPRLLEVYKAATRLGKKQEHFGLR